MCTIIAAQITNWGYRMAQEIGVGLVGARADRGWGSTAHVPAIKAVATLDLKAVATTQTDTARAAAAAFDIPLAFGDPFELIRHPDVDLVSVSVKAPAHRALVLAAIEAGKAVMCEWPLGVNLAESEELAGAAEKYRVKTAIGLQGRVSPWINHLRALIKTGVIGRILSTTFFAADDFSIGTVSQGNVYMLDPSNGANPLTIHGGHFVDALCHVLGEFDVVSAQIATSRPDVIVRESGEHVRSTSPDQIAIAGALRGGAVASIHIRGGRTIDAPLVWEIQGTDGTLRVTSPRGYLHWWPLKIEIAKTRAERFQVVETPEHFFSSVTRPGEGMHQNVAYLYADFARDIINSTHTTADFAAALARHRTIDAIAKAATKGVVLVPESVANEPVTHVR